MYHDLSDRLLSIWLSNPDDVVEAWLLISHEMSQATRARMDYLDPNEPLYTDLLGAMDEIERFAEALLENL